MSAIARAMLIGRVGNDPEVIHVGDQQTARVRLRIAVSRVVFDQATQQFRQLGTDWFTVLFWRELAERVSQTVRKGDLIFVEGDLRTREWTDDQGNRREVTEIHAVLYRKLTSPAGTASTTEEAFQKELTFSGDFPPEDQQPEDLLEEVQLPSVEEPSAMDTPSGEEASGTTDQDQEGKKTQDDLPF